MIQTRWHEDDLAGRLLQQADEGGERWEVVDLPALAEAGREDALRRAPGQPLWPARFDEQRLAVIRTTVREQWWEAMYQQRPPETLGGRYFRAFRPSVDGKPYHVWPVEALIERYSLERGAFPPLPGEARRPRVDAVGGRGRRGARPLVLPLVRPRPPAQAGLRLGRAVRHGRDAPAPGPAHEAAHGLRRRALAGVVGGPGQRLAHPVSRVTAPESARLHLDSIRVDPSMFAPRANVGVSDATVYAGGGVPVQKAYNDRVMGWRRLLEWLEARTTGCPAWWCSRAPARTWSGRCPG